MSGGHCGMRDALVEGRLGLDELCGAASMVREGALRAE